MAFTERELALLLGDAEPATDEELDWYEKHSSDIVSGDDGLRKSVRRRASPTRQRTTTFASSQSFTPPTLAAASAEAMDKTKDRLEEIGEKLTGTSKKE